MKSEFLLTVVCPYINLLLFAGILAYFLRGPLVQFFRGQRDGFLKDREQAERLHSEAYEALQLLDTRLQSIDGEIARMKEDARAEAEREASSIVAKAEKRVEILQREAQRCLEQDLSKARDQLRLELVKLVSDKVVASLSERVDQKTSSQLTARYLKSIPSTLGAISSKQQ